jgi:hypothetical protein
MGMDMNSFKAGSAALGPTSATRPGERQRPTIDGYRAQHLALAERQIATEHGCAQVTVDESESPLAWLGAGADATAVR